MDEGVNVAQVFRPTNSKRQKAKGSLVICNRQKSKCVNETDKCRKRMRYDRG